MNVLDKELTEPRNQQNANNHNPSLRIESKKKEPSTKVARMLIVPERTIHYTI